MTWEEEVRDTYALPDWRGLVDSVIALKRDPEAAHSREAVLHVELIRRLATCTSDEEMYDLQTIAGLLATLHEVDFARWTA